MTSVWLTFEFENEILKPPTSRSRETSIGVKGQHMKSGHMHPGRWVVASRYSSALRKTDHLK